MTPVEQALTKAFAQIWKVLKASDADLQAHKNAIDALLTNHQELRPDLDAFLTVARHHPALAEKMNQKYALVLDTFLRTIPETETRLEVQATVEAIENLNS